MATFHRNTGKFDLLLMEKTDRKGGQNHRNLHTAGIINAKSPIKKPKKVVKQTKDENNPKNNIIVAIDNFSFDVSF